MPSDFTGGNIAGNVLPDATGRDLGSTGYRWDLFANALDIAGGSLGGVRIADPSTAGSIQTAISSLPAAGGVIFLPFGAYTLTAALDCGSKKVIFQGCGWSSGVVATFGDAQWTTSNVTGTVLNCTSTTLDGFIISTATTAPDQIIFRDLCFLGPGSGTTKGINLSSTSTTYIRTENVGIFNFSTGLYLSNVLDSQFDVYVRGCTTGISFDTAGSETEIVFPYVEVQACTTGISAVGAGIHVKAGLIQSNTLGIDVRCTQSSFSNIWYEANTNDIRLNSTSTALSDITFANSRSGSSGIVQTTGANVITRVLWENFSAGGVNGPIVPAGSVGWQFIGCNFASAPDLTNGGGTVIGGSQYAGMQQGVANQPLRGPTGVGLISASAANINIGRYGSVTADSVNHLANSHNFGDAAASTTWARADSAALQVWSGVDIRGYSGQGTGLTYAMDSATGKVTTYNGVTTVSAGQPSEVATVDLTVQGASIGTTTLYAVPAAGAGQYIVSWNAKITTAATTGAATSTLGALTIVYTDPDSVVVTLTCAAMIAAGTIATTSTANTTGTVLIGVPLTLNCKASTNITYAMAYASNTAAEMKYNLHIKCEAMG